MIRDSPEKYHILRAHTCIVLHQNYNISTDRITSLTELLNHQISPFDHGHNLADLKSVLHKIVTKAFELGAMIAQAKASYYPYGLYIVETKATLDQSWMEIPCKKPVKGPGIDILIAPALVKYSSPPQIIS